MRFYKIVDDGFIVMVGEGGGGTEITESEYSTILDIIHAAPTAPEGYAYMLRADTLEWELVELPPVVIEYDEETALTQYANELTGATDETLIEAAETMIHKILEEENE